MEITNTVAERELDDYLYPKFKFGLYELADSIEEIKALYDLVGFSKSLKRLEESGKGLTLARKTPIRLIDEFMEKTGRWDYGRRRYPENKAWTKDERHAFIVKKFHLRKYLNKIDREIERLKKRLIYYRELHPPTSDLKKRIKPHTMLLLTWVLALESGCPTLTERYEMAEALFSWYLQNAKDFLTELVGEMECPDVSAIRRDYERYIGSPNPRQRIYGELASQIHEECLFNAKGKIEEQMEEENKLLEKKREEKFVPPPSKQSKSSLEKVFTRRTQSKTARDR